MELTGFLTLAEVEQAARSSVDQAAWSYLAGGAGADRTVRANVAAFESIWLVPRIAAVQADTPTTRTNLMGRDLAMPILLAPTSPQRLFHENAELATAKAAAAAGTISIVSSDSHYPFAAVASSCPGCCWFQLYAYGSRSSVRSALDMAEAADAGAIVVTVDAHYPARRIGARRAGFRTPREVDFGTLRALGILSTEVPADARLQRMPLTWADLDWIRAQTALPLLLKGLVHPEDANRAVDLGADGIIVSNHGGRQLDGVVPSVIALQRIVAGLKSKCVILVDGGIRSGIDVVKALALGANAVCIGRPYLWGLALAGQEGVAAVLTMLCQEMEDTLRQLGLSGVHDVDSDCVADVGWPAGLHGFATANWE